MTGGNSPSPQPRLGNHRSTSDSDRTCWFSLAPSETDWPKELDVITIECGADLFDRARLHLSTRAEQVGFFLADFDAERRSYLLMAWRPMSDDRYELRGDYHVTLTDEA